MYCLSYTMSRFLVYATIVVVACIFNCFGDISLHNPRGNNDRLNEATRNRENANRLFNSQNNARGGYNLGEEPMYYYAGSHLEIQWAVQHTCGDENNNCEMVLQYMCGDHIQAGTGTKRSLVDRGTCTDKNCHESGTYGINERFHYYEKCASRERNKGLYTADQKVQETSKSTRQNAGGTRYGYECQEERDYYPYWGPSPWRDIVVFTNNPERCDYYRQESQNVKERYECIIDEFDYWLKRDEPETVLFQTQEECEAKVFKVKGIQYKGRWVRVESHGILPPECRQSPWSRDNHQGNTFGGQFVKYDWTLPHLEDEEAKCVLRIRYNISTNDYNSWETDSSFNEGNNNPILTTSGMDVDELKRRQYYFQNNPDVDVFKAVDRRKQRLRFKLAINTAQFGRTFQDRTHPFFIKHRPKAIRDKVIYNINVRGKRGNLQQVYPATEYDFVPNKLHISQGEMVHFQWTGANTNPTSNAGQGKARTDRSNIVPLAPRTFNVGAGPFDELSNHTLRTNYPLKSLDFLGFIWKKPEKLAFLEQCSKDPLLSDQSAYFDLGPQSVDLRGSFYYMSTRNNQFTNRNQKASIIVGEAFYLGSDKGSSYRGHESRTVSGRICQRWDSQYPHRHQYTPESHPDDGLDENFCRNPDTRLKSKMSPWCFTTDPEKVWELCAIESESQEERKERYKEEERFLEALAVYSDLDKKEEASE